MDDKTAIECMRIINKLRSKEGDDVTILCDNPEGPPNNVVICNGWWTDWIDRRFQGTSLVLALQNAEQRYDDWIVGRK